MMKILALTDSFLPHAGGSRVYYYNLYRRLAEECGDEVRILTGKLAGGEEFDRQNSTSRFSVLRRGRPLTTWHYRELAGGAVPLVNALAEIMRLRPDVIHAGDLYPQGLTALLCKRLMGIPYVAFCHGEDLTLTEPLRQQRRLRNAIYRSADAVVAACEFARQGLLGLGISENKVRKILPGVDPQRFFPKAANPALVDRFKLQGKVVILTVSRLCPRKGHDLVLRAMAQLLTQGQPLHYVIVGQGPDESRLRRLTEELGLTTAVTFAGLVPEGELCDFYNLCDVFVMPNREEANGDTEGFGMVFLEASACGKPVIGGHCGGTADAIVDGVTGFRVRGDHPDELIGAMNALVAFPAWRSKLGKAGLLRAQSLFEWTERAASLHKVSREAVTGAGRSPRPAPLSSLESAKHRIEL